MLFLCPPGLSKGEELSNGLVLHEILHTPSAKLNVLQLERMTSLLSLFFEKVSVG